MPVELTCRCGQVFLAVWRAQRYCNPKCSPNWAKYKPPGARGGREGHAYRKLRAQVFAEETHCWLCGELVDFTLRYPHRMSKSLDHVVLVAHGGAERDRANARLAHLDCNQRRGWRR